MTVNTTTNKIIHTGNSLTLEFPFDFLVYETGHLFVWIDGAAVGNYFIKGLGNSNGGSVVFDTPPINGVQVLIFRQVPLTQLIDYVPFDQFPSETNEKGLDLGVMRAQQASEFDGRTLRVPITDPAVEEVPNVAIRRRTLLGFDDIGNPIAGASLDDFTGGIQRLDQLLDVTLLDQQTGQIMRRRDNGDDIYENVDLTASIVIFDPSNGSLISTDVQGAIDELEAGGGGGIQAFIDYYYDVKIVGGEVLIFGEDDFGKTLAYSVGSVEVHLNGVMLMQGAGLDYTATDGTQIENLSPALVATDVMLVRAFTVFAVADTYTKAEQHGLFLDEALNLSDLTDVQAARDNLGIGDGSVPGTNTVGTEAIRTATATMSLLVDGDESGLAEASMLVVGGIWAFEVYTGRGSTAISPATPHGIPAAGDAGARIAFANRDVNGAMAYANSHYVTASPPYDLGDGEIPLFVYIMENGGEVIGTVIAEDPPWIHHGPHAKQLYPDRVDILTGKKYSTVFTDGAMNIMVDRPPAGDQVAALQWLADKAAGTQIEIEITTGIKNMDIDEVPHPFIDPPMGATVKLLDPFSQTVADLKRLLLAGSNPTELIYNGSVVIGSTPLARVNSPGVITVDASWS